MGHTDSNPDRPLIEVDTEDDYRTDTRRIKISIDINFAVIVVILAVTACVVGMFACRLL